MRLVLDVWVAGVPVTKGSVNVNRGGTGVRQAAKGYAAWSDAVRRAARDARSGVVERHEGALIRCRFWVPSPPYAHVYSGLWAPGARDGDKLERSVWDALTAAGVWQDDAQVIEWSGSRRWTFDGREPGAHISVYALSAEDVARDEAPVRDSHAAYDRWRYGSGAARTGG